MNQCITRFLVFETSLSVNHNPHNGWVIIKAEQVVSGWSLCECKRVPLVNRNLIDPLAMRRGAWCKLEGPASDALLEQRGFWSGLRVGIANACGHEDNREQHSCPTRLSSLLHPSVSSVRYGTVRSGPVRSIHPASVPLTACPTPYQRWILTELKHPLSDPPSLCRTSLILSPYRSSNAADTEGHYMCVATVHAGRRGHRVYLPHWWTPGYTIRQP